MSIIIDNWIMWFESKENAYFVNKEVQEELFTALRVREIHDSFHFVLNSNNISCKLASISSFPLGPAQPHSITHYLAESLEVVCQIDRAEIISDYLENKLSTVNIQSKNKKKHGIGKVWSETRKIMIYLMESKMKRARQIKPCIRICQLTIAAYL